MACMKSGVVKSSFDIGPTILNKILQLGHNYLTYALGPAIMSRGPPLTSLEWSDFFIYQIHEFEKQHILLNGKIIDPRKKNLP